MSFDVKIKIKSDKFENDFDAFRRELEKSIRNGPDKAMSVAVDKLKAELRTLLRGNIGQEPRPAPVDKPLLLSSTLDRSRKELAQHIFGVDIDKALVAKKEAGIPKIIDDTSNLFFAKNGFIVALQTNTQASTISQHKSTFKKRLLEGMVIDLDSGKFIKIKEQDINDDDIKYGCSSGGPGSDKQLETTAKRHDNLRNTAGGTIRKYDSPDQRPTPVTIYQTPAKRLLKNGIDAGEIIDMVLDGDSYVAKETLRSLNLTGNLDKSIEKLEEYEEGKNLPSTLEAQRNVEDLINNLKLRKEISDEKVVYTLFSSYGQDTRETVDFLKEIKTHIHMWKVTNSEKWFKAILDSVDKAIKKYFKA